jgi:diguanylate cyclase (GGDEF)-like protein/putative nucleotidyltransferase with HDIG domain
MTKRTWLYISMIYSVGIGLVIAAFLQPAINVDWQAFAFLMVLATGAQVFKAEAPGHRIYHGALVFYFAGVILLQPLPLVLVLLFAYLVEWLWAFRQKGEYLRAWYLQPFNIAMHLISAMAAHGIYSLINGGSTLLQGIESVGAAIAAIAVFVLLNHLIMSIALVLARGIPWKDTSIFDLDELVPDLVNLAMGFTFAIVWQIDPWMALPSLAPMLLVYRAMSIPQLKHEASVDAKTSLLNALHLNRQFDAELGRAERFAHPLSLIMADLDLLRNVNNTYGHLAGDIVLGELGKLINASLRSYEIAGRFGGEEFAIVLPETSLEEARERAETLRKTIEQHPITIPSQEAPIFVTMSLGVSSFPDNASDRDDLVQIADTALYHAKANGRNLVVCAGEVPAAMPVVQEQAAPTPESRPMPRLESAPSSPEPGLTRTVQPAPTTLDQTRPAGNTPQPTTDDGSTPQTYNDDQANRFASAARRMQIEHKLLQESSGTEAQPGRSPAAQMRYLWWFIGFVLIAGVSVGTALTLAFPPQLTTGYFLTIAILVIGAVLAEVYLVDLYGESSVSVSVAVAFAAAVITGMPGVMLVSAAIAITAFWSTASKRRIQLERIAFNWATHSLAGAVPVLLLADFSFSLDVANLLQLGLIVFFSSVLYFLIDSGLVAIAVALSSGRKLQLVWAERFAWLAGHYILLCTVGLMMGIAHTTLSVLGLVIFLAPVAATRHALQQYTERTRQHVQELQRLNRELTRANQSVMQANESIREYSDELLLTLAKVIDTRDPSVAGHSARVADFAVALARALKLPADHVERIRQSALLHDIGKIGIPERILYKPGRLTDAEFAKIKTHAGLGAELIETNRSLRRLAPAVRHHHERWDGLGYPAGLQGSAIPIDARILAVCDTAEVMLSERSYSPGRSLADTIAEIERCAGSQFDPEIAAHFVRIAEEHLSLSGDSGNELQLGAAAGDKCLELTPSRDQAQLNVQQYTRLAS